MRPAHPIKGESILTTDNTAYNLSDFAPRPERERQALRVAPTDNRPAKLFGRLDVRWVKAVALASVMLALVCSVLFSQTRATELTASIASRQSDLTSLKSEYTYLSNEMEMKTNLKTVELYATQKLGLVQMDKSQITYVTSDDANRIERHEKGLAQAAREISGGVLSFMEYLAP